MPFSSADPLVFLGIGMQSALGTPQTTAAKFRFLRYLASDLDVDISAVDIREGGDGFDFGFTYKQKQVIRGQLVLNVRPEGAGQALALAIGGATWDGASAPAAHTFAPVASYPWFTVIGQHPGSQLQYLVSDAKFTGFTFDLVAGQPWKLTLPFVGITHGGSFSVVPTANDAGVDPLLYHSTPTYVFNGVADSDITEIHISAQYGLDEIQTQAVTLDELPILNRDMNLSLTRRFESEGLWEQVYYGASGNIVPTQSVATGSMRAAAAYGAGAGLRQLDLQIPLLSLRNNKLTGIDPDGKTVYETIDAKILKGATSSLIAYLKNAHASAYLS